MREPRHQYSAPPEPSHGVSGERQLGYLVRAVEEIADKLDVKSRQDLEDKGRMVSFRKCRSYRLY